GHSSPETRGLAREELPGPRPTCIGCRRRRPHRELVRLVRAGDGSLQIGRTLPGRGAWLCADTPECSTEAMGRKGFERALRGPIDRASVEGVRRELFGGVPGTT